MTTTWTNAKIPIKVLAVLAAALAAWLLLQSAVSPAGAAPPEPQAAGEASREEADASGSRRLCGRHRELVEALKRGYAERPSFAGLSAEGGVLEIHASEDLRTWTALNVTPDGQACVVAAGKGWSGREPEPVAGAPGEDV